MIHVKLPPRLDKLPPHQINRVLTRALTQIRDAFTSKQPITISSPDARTSSGRRKIRETFRHAGLEPDIVALLGWSTTYPGAEAPLAQPAVNERTSTEACQHPSGSMICGAPMPCPDHPEAAEAPEPPPTDLPTEPENNAVR